MLDVPAGDGEHIIIAYDGGGPGPLVTVDGADELHTAAEMRAVGLALQLGAILTESFGQPVDLAEWRRDHA